MAFIDKTLLPEQPWILALFIDIHGTTYDNHAFLEAPGFRREGFSKFLAPDILPTPLFSPNPQRANVADNRSLIV